MELDLATPAATRTLLQKFNFSPLKRLGQHFLVDKNILRKILAASELQPTDVVLEVGAGIGTLTLPLALKVKHVISIEFDHRLSPILKDTLIDQSNVTVLLKDALRLLPKDLPPKINLPNKLVSNLPYQITSPLIAHLLENFPFLKLLVIMVQKEVGDRIMAKPGSKDYGNLSVKVSYFCDAKKIGEVSRHVFFPKPEVDSLIIKLRRRKEPAVKVADEKLFFNIVRSSFTWRRKMIKNTLVSQQLISKRIGDISKLLEELNIDPQRRGETLSLEEFAKIANALAKAGRER
jgi:16S rRNA (adenine1518-N6/adenine1519-N6)-dimethyltransferase